MDMLRRNMFWIICGIVGLVGIGLGVIGLQGMPKVMAEMESAASVYKSLDTLQSAKVNERAIQAERERIAKIQEDYRKVLDRAKQLYGYVPLLAEGESQEAFLENCQKDPEVRSLSEEDRDAECERRWFEKIGFPNGTPLQLIEFRKRYNAAIDGLYSQLQCGSPPTQTEINQMKDRRANEIAQGLQTPGEPRTPAGVLTAAGLRDDAAARAAIAKALSISCYCVPIKDEKPPEAYASLQYNAAMKETDAVVAPDPFEVWMAQVAYWIQKDVVEAIRDVNEIAAQRAREAGLSPWVGTMAVKDVISIRLSPAGYVPPEGDLVVVAKPGDYTPALPPGTGESVFTQSKTGKSFEVVQFTVKLIMDQRDVPLLIERLSNNKFHTLVRASYVAMPPNRELKGKIYGPEPVVNVVLDFESIMLGEVFRPMMPESVCSEFEIPCPKSEEKKP
jgi:hypothetical protein